MFTLSNGGMAQVFILQKAAAEWMPIVSFYRGSGAFPLPPELDTFRGPRGAHGGAAQANRAGRVGRWVMIHAAQWCTKFRRADSPPPLQRLYDSEWIPLVRAAEGGQARGEGPRNEGNLQPLFRVESTLKAKVMGKVRKGGKGQGG